MFNRISYHDDSKLDLVFFARKIGGVAGGLERMLIALMNELIHRGHRVRLVTWDRQGAVAYYKMDHRISWFQLNVCDSDVSASLFERVRRMRSAREFLRSVNPDILVGFQSGAALFACFCSFGLNIKTIASERVSPDMWKFTRKGWKNRLLDIYSLGLAQKITVQFEDYIKYYPRILRRKIVTIPNPVYQVSHSRNVRKTGGFVVLYVARLCFQKNHQLLLRAFALIASEFKDWRVLIAGDGEYDSRVSALVKTLGLDDKVDLLGSVADVESLYVEGDIVAFPSLFEGFPNALGEALACGLPCIGLRDTLGVNKLIQNGVNGLLVENNPVSFADGLTTLMSNVILRNRMGAKASQITERFPPQTSFDLWESLILEVSGK